jgi:hypothetical protein
MMGKLMKATRKAFALIVMFLLLLNIAGAQQLQQLDDTDSLKQRREKTNINFQMLLDKVNLNYTTLNSKPPIQTYTRSTLPSSAPAGTIATISDSVGGAWLRSRVGKWFEIGGEKVNVEEYSNLAAAVSDASTSQRRIEIPNGQGVSSNLIIPANVLLDFTGTGQISVANGVTLTVQSDSRAWPLRQIFSGSGTVRFGTNVTESYPQWFGGKLDGTTDDAAAAQKAIDAFKQLSNAPTAGTVTITGPMAIGSTLNFFDNPVRLVGKGSFGSGGYASDNARNNYIKWIGSAGIPMLLVHSLGSIIEHLHLIGKSSAKPSAAIEFSESGSYFGDNLAVRDVWIGPMYGWDDDTGTQFDRGIYFSGSLDGDTNLLERVFIVNCTTGIDIASGNASVDHFDTIQTIGCVTGLKTVAPQVIVTTWICGNNDVDLDMASQGVYVELYNYASEGSGRMAVGSSLAPYRLIVRGGGFQADGSGKFGTSHADFSGKRAFIQFKGLAAIATYIDLHDFSLTTAGTPATPIIQCWATTDNVTGSSSTAVHLKVEACPGILSSTIDVGNDAYKNSSRIVEYTAFPAGQVQAQMTRFVQNSGYGSEDDTFQDGRFDLLGKVNVYGGPLKVKKLADLGAGVSATPTGSGATNYSYKVVPITYDGHAAPSSAATCTNTATLDVAHYNTIFWYPIPGSYAYQIYGRTPGSEQLLTTFTLSSTNQQGGNLWKDDGSITPSGALPSGNTTGNAAIDGILKIGSTPVIWNDAAGKILPTALNTVQPAQGGLGATGTPSNGQIPIGNGSTYTPATIIPGGGIAVTNGSGSVTIATTGEQLLASVAGVNMKSASKQALYTVPSGKHLIITRIVIRSASASISDGNYLIGYNSDASGMLGGIVGPTTTTYVSLAVDSLLASDIYPLGNAGDVLGLASTALPANAATATILVFGYLY